MNQKNILTKIISIFIFILIFGVFFYLLFFQGEKPTENMAGSTSSITLTEANNLSTGQNFTDSTDYKILAPVSYNDSLNIYTDIANKYSVLYPKILKIHQFNDLDIVFVDENGDGPWLIAISINDANKPFYDQQDIVVKSNGTKKITILKRTGWKDEGNFFETIVKSFQFLD